MANLIMCKQHDQPLFRCDHTPDAKEAVKRQTEQSVTAWRRIDDIRQRGHKFTKYRI